MSVQSSKKNWIFILTTLLLFIALWLTPSVICRMRWSTWRTAVHFETHSEDSYGKHKVAAEDFLLWLNDDLAFGIYSSFWIWWSHMLGRSDWHWRCYLKYRADREILNRNFLSPDRSDHLFVVAYWSGFYGMYDHSSKSLILAYDDTI